MNEATYQSMLLTYLEQQLSFERLWPTKGCKTTYCGRLLRPDLEIESDFAGKISTIAIIELKFNSRYSMWQPMTYAVAKNIPAYCAVDGFRRTPIKWRFNHTSSQLGVLDRTVLDEKLLKIKKTIEEFNYQNFI